MSLTDKFIVTADLHLRSDRPRCRTDEDWGRTQGQALGFIAEEANRHDCPVAIPGDIFNNISPPFSLILLFYAFCKKVKKGVYIMAGNHDAPYHNFDLIETSAFGLLWSLTDLKDSPIRSIGELGSFAHFGQEVEKKKESKLLFLHRLVFLNAKSIPPNVNATTAQELLQEYPDYDFIFTGDMHKSFVFEAKGRYVINPGCLLRQAADFIDYKPSVYLVEIPARTTTQIFIPDREELVTDFYISKAKEREDRTLAFIEGIKKSGKISLSFFDNLYEYFGKSNHSQETLTMVDYLVSGGT